MIRVDSLGLKYLSLAERKQLPGKDAGTVGGIQNALQPFPPGILHVSTVQQHLGKAADDVVYRLLKSCAMPPASLPIDAIL
jgi:hypothetical protein